MKTTNLAMRTTFTAIVLFSFVHFTGAAAAGEIVLSIVAAGKPGPGAAHGLNKLIGALEASGTKTERVAAPSSARGKILILAALAADASPAAALLKTAGVSLPTGPEALVIRRGSSGGKPALAVVGSDDRGLMYALLDVADRVGWATDPNDPLGEVRNAAEKPFTSERALSIYTMHRACFEARFFDEKYWARYLDMLAENRFNSFVLIFGYENAGYFTPPYPFLFDVEGFSDVRVVGLTKEQQARNLKALNRLVEMTHERGLNFTLGIWDHIYRGGVQGPTDRARNRTPGVVWGLTADKLVPYTEAALTKLLREVPNLDAIQFRMHGESGLRRGEMEKFWTNVYRIMTEHGRGIRFDARAKNFPHALIDKAVEMKVPIRICTKYWMEQMGLPFHPTHVHPRNQHDRRHGYADLLRYPKQYDMHWRLWNAGTTRILLWGDPEYVRRFAESTRLYDGRGFEVTEPMGTKMQDHPHEKPPFALLRPKYQYYDWEFERYWHFFQVFGRMGYNPNTPPEVWQKEFERRFGKEAGPLVERAIHRASQILPRTVAYSYPYHHFPTTRGWVERQRQEDLPVYAKALPSDTEQFLSMDDAARFRLEGKDSAKIWPRQSAEWFARTAREVLGLVDQAEKRIGKNRSKEFDSTMVDLKILANLAMYHSWRARAGVRWALWKRSADRNMLDDAIEHESRAVAAWAKIVESAGDVYHDDLMMGRRSADLSGHWKDELAKLRRGLENLKQQRKDARPKAIAKRVAPASVSGDSEPPAIVHEPITNAPAEKPLTVAATVTDPSGVKWVRLRYRGVNQQFDYKTLPMKPAGKKDRYQAEVPAEHVAARWDFMYFIEVMDHHGNGKIYPDLEKETPYVIVELQR